MINGSASRPFSFKDCALAAIATGRRARNLRELRDQLQQVDAGSVYYHFWGGRLRPQFDEPEYNNDFAAWTRHALRDQIAAERLAVIDPTAFPDLEDLRSEVLDVIEQRLSEEDTVSFSKTDEQFSFLRSQIVVFDTHRVIERPEDLCESIPQSSTGSIFYHFIDARRRTADGLDDYSTWLHGFGGGHEGLLAQLADLDPYFTSLSDLRTLITEAVNKHFPSPSKGGI
jgi:hypothetical protein